MAKSYKYTQSMKVTIRNKTTT